MTEHKTLAIFGNYLSELDQTKTLENLGATLLKTSHTAPTYRLFASNDTQAVLCEDKDNGRQIRVEIWQINASTILDFFEQVPTNHHLAKLNLSDGTSHLAFLAPLHFCLEQTYEEASRFGGWERYLLKTAESEV